MHITLLSLITVEVSVEQSRKVRRLNSGRVQDQFSPQNDRSPKRKEVMSCTSASMSKTLSLDDYASSSPSGFQGASAASVNSLSPKPLQPESSPSTNMSHSTDNSLPMPQSSAGNVVSFPCDNICFEPADSHSKRQPSLPDGSSLISHQPRLAEFYDQKSAVPQDVWPPVVARQYINLAWIICHKFDLKDEYSRETIRGTVDDIMHKKEKVTYESVIEEVKDGDRILFDGRPGCGKTTTMHKISQDWACDKTTISINKECQKSKKNGIFPRTLLFLVHLRKFGSKSDIELSDILRATSRVFSMDEINAMCKVIENSNGKGVVFIFDGLDEYRPQEKKENLIYDLIRGNYLPLSVVIVASRPAASHKFRKYMKKHIEILGFLKEQIYDYIDCYYHGKTEQAEGLKTYLVQHPNVLHMCYLPIHVTMITFLYEKMRTNLPQTETEIYHRFTLYTLMRFLGKQNDPEDSDSEYIMLQSFDDIEGGDQKVLVGILQLAFDATVDSKLFFSRSDEEVKVLFSSQHCNTSEANTSKLGLLVVDRDDTLYGPDELYTFLHLTFQEYLATCHVARLRPSEQSEIITRHAKKKHLAVVFKFYCGMTREKFTQNNVMENFKVLMRENTSNSLLCIHCAHESQQECTCTYIVESNDGAVRVNKQSLNAADCTALGYVLKKSAVPAKVIELTSCTIFPESFTAFMKGCGDDSLSSLESLRLLLFCTASLCLLDLLICM